MATLILSTAMYALINTMIKLIVFSLHVICISLSVGLVFFPFAFEIRETHFYRPFFFCIEKWVLNCQRIKATNIGYFYQNVFLDRVTHSRDKDSVPDTTQENVEHPWELHHSKTVRQWIKKFFFWHSCYICLKGIVLFLATGHRIFIFLSIKNLLR